MLEIFFCHYLHVGCIKMVDGKAIMLKWANNDMNGPVSLNLEIKLHDYFFSSIVLLVLFCRCKENLFVYHYIQVLILPSLFLLVFFRLVYISYRRWNINSLFFLTEMKEEENLISLKHRHFPRWLQGKRWSSRIEHIIASLPGFFIWHHYRLVPGNRFESALY